MSLLLLLKGGGGGSVDVTVSGETLTVTLSLIDGAATGTASVAGETQTATPTLTDGAVTGTASLIGETLTAFPTLTDGAISADADVGGEVQPSIVSLIDGTVTTSLPGTEANELLQEDGRFILQEDGSYIQLDVTTLVAGETLTVTSVLVDGTASGEADLAGETLIAGSVLIDGRADAGSAGTVASELKTESDVFIVQEDGSYIRLDVPAEDVSVLGDAIAVTLLLIDGDVSIVGADQPPIKPPGGDDAPVWVNPTYRKDVRRKRPHEVEEDLEALYDRVMGIEPVTKEAKKAVRAVRKAVEPYREPETSDLDWLAMENDLRVAVALRKAIEAIEEDEEEALTALLLAG